MLSKLCPMSGETIMNLSVSSNYGYCVLVALGSAFVLVWKSFKVGRARKQYNVPYPTMYSADNTQFNCVQRAHQNTLENYPQFLMMLLLGGLDSPLLSAVGGMIWLAGRVAYAKGYYTGDPAKRMKGSFGYIGLLLLLGTTSKLGLRMIGVL